MEGKQRLGRDVFIALAAVGWADGELSADEADAIVRTALEEGLEIDEIAEIEAATQSPVEMGVIDRSNLSKEDRLFVYAVASWMTRLDQKVDARETEALARLGEVLKIPEGPRAQADQIALEVAGMAEGDAPSRYDLPKLRKVIGKRLEESAARRSQKPD
jgi:hypothetical protein